MNKTVFNFSYETNPVEEVIIEPVKTLPDSLLESFDSKIACFTNKVPLDELSDMVKANYRYTAMVKSGKGSVDDLEGKLSSVKSSNLPDSDVEKYSKDLKRKLHNREVGVARSVPKPVDVKEENTYTIHLKNIGGGENHGNKTTFRSKHRTVNSAIKNLSDFSDASNGKDRQIATHVTDSDGKVVWKDDNHFKESVEQLSELSSKLLGQVKAAHEKNYENSVKGDFKGLKGSVKLAPSQTKAISASYEGIKKAKAKAAEAKAREDAEHMGRQVESVKADTNKIDPEFSDDAEFSTDFNLGVKKNEMHGIDKVDPMPKLKPDSSNKTTEKKASADHGPRINQEPIKKATMESVTFSYKDLIEIFSEEITESVLGNAWEIEVYKDGDIFKYAVKDGDDIIAEGTNLNIKSAAKTAYRKCLTLESQVISKVSQPARVAEIIKNLK